MTKSIKIFDICGTLYDSNTTMDFCQYCCQNRYLKVFLKASCTLPFKIVNKISLNIFNIDLIRNLHILTLKNRDICDIEQQAQSFTEIFLENKKIKTGHEKLNTFDASGIILVSATIEPIAKAIAKKLKVPTYKATTLQQNNNSYSGKIEKDLLSNKHHLFDNEPIDFVMTDNISDLHLCQKSKQSIILSKPKHLKFWQSHKTKDMQIMELT